MVKNPNEPGVFYGLEHGANGVIEQENLTLERFVSIAERAYRGEAILTPKIMAVLFDQINQTPDQSLHRSPSKQNTWVKE